MQESPNHLASESPDRSQKDTDDQIILKHFEQTIEIKLDKGLKKMYGLLLEYINETLDYRESSMSSPK